MFKIECMAEDKNLAKTLRALASVAALNVVSTPVGGAETKGGKIVAKGDGSLAGVVMAELKGTKPSIITKTQVANILGAAGLNRNSAGYVIKTLLGLKAIKPTKKGKANRGNYEVLI